MASFNPTTTTSNHSHVSPLSLPTLVFLLTCVMVISYLLYLLFRPDLRDIPGPFLAKFTDLHRLLQARSYDIHTRQIALHRKHGPLVRIGPNFVSCSDPSAVQAIYSVKARLPKGDFYPVMGNVDADGRAVPSIFTCRDEKTHESMRRPIAQIYAMTNIKEFEPFVNSTEDVFFSTLRRNFADTGRAFDLSQWLHWFAADVIGEITFGARLGFLEREEDIDGIIAKVEDRFTYVGVVGQMPWLDQLLHKNKAFAWFKGLFQRPKSSYVLSFALRRIQERREDRRRDPGRKGAEKDLLGRFLDVMENNPELPRSWIISWCQQNIQAGSDSTAITLTAVFYYLLKNPWSLQRLVAEIDAANLPSPTPWDKAKELPYLDACIKEALRLQPAVGIPLERVVPDGGITLHGHHLRAGTVVGVNAWIVHRDRELFGDDADYWRPERWTEAGREKRKAMERAFLAFGSGSRICLGNNISYLEMYKLIPEMLSKFEFELADPDKEWWLKNIFFVYTKGVEVKIKNRESLPVVSREK